MHYLTYMDAKGMLAGFIGFNVATIFGVITVETLIQALVLGAVSAFGGFAMNRLINWIKKLIKKQ